jgi:hypothetical protein
VDVLDLLECEARRQALDFRHCAAQPGATQRSRLARALLQRVAALLLALDHALLPALPAIDGHAEVLRLHEALKARVAEALLACCGEPARAWHALCLMQFSRQRYRALLRRRLYPALRGAMTDGERLLLGAQLMDWLRHNRRQDARPAARRRRGGVAAGSPPPALDLRQVPTLHHVVGAPLEVVCHA